VRARVEARLHQLEVEGSVGGVDREVGALHEFREVRGRRPGDGDRPRLPAPQLRLEDLRPFVDEVREDDSVDLLLAHEVVRGHGSCGPYSNEGDSNAFTSGGPRRREPT